MNSQDIKLNLDPSQDYIFTTANGIRTNPMPPCAFDSDAVSIDVVTKGRTMNMWSKKTSWNPQPYKALIVKIVKLIDHTQEVSDDFIHYGIRDNTPVDEMITTFFEGSACGITILPTPAFGVLDMLVDGYEETRGATFDINTKKGELITATGHDLNKKIAVWNTDLNTTLCDIEKN